MTDRWQLALRTALSALLAGLISTSLHFEDPFWSMVTVFMLSTPFAETTVIKAFFRIIGTGAGAIGGLIAAALTANDRVLSLAVLFVVTSTGSYFALRRKHSYPWILGLATYYLIALSATGSPSELWSTALWRFIEVVVGVVVILLVDLLFRWKEAVVRLPAIIDAVCVALSQSWQALWVPEGNRESLRSLDQNIKKLDQLIEAVRVSRKGDRVLLQMITESLESYRHVYFTLAEFYQTFTGEISLNAEALSQLSIETLIEPMTQVLRHAGLPTQMHSKLIELRNQLNRAWSEWERRCVPGGLQGDANTLDQVAFIYSLFHFLEQLTQQLEEISRLGRLDAAKMRVGFLGSPAQGLPACSRLALTRGLRIGISAVVTMLVWLWSAWWAARIGVISALVVGLEQDTLGTGRKGVQRILGNVLGAGLGLGLLSLFVGDAISLFVLFFLGSLLTGYVIAGPTPWPYVGMQMGIGFSLAMISSTSLSSSIALPLQRVAGVLLGSAIAILSAMIIWPMSAKQALDQGLSRVFSDLARLLAEAGRTQQFVNELFLSILRSHHANAEMVEGVDDEVRIKMWRLEEIAVLHILSLQQLHPMMTKTQELSTWIELELQSLAKKFADLSSFLLVANSLSWDERALNQKREQLQRDLDKLRQADWFQRLPVRQQGAIISALWKIQQLYGCLIQYVPLRPDAPQILNKKFRNNILIR